LLEEFVQAVQEVFPRVLLQFEDFSNHVAFTLLERWRDRICCFNDDIQGTAAVAVAGMFSALRITGQPLAAQRVLFVGAGEAGIGIADLLCNALVAQGVPLATARQQCWFFDSKGLVTAARSDLNANKQRYAHTAPPGAGGDLLAAVQALRPTALIGVSGQTGAIPQPVVAAMAAANARPIVFALSNPTSKAECTAEQAYAWSDGRAIFASGSPFAPVRWQGKELVPGQGNNAYIFPGVGLGVVASGSRRVPEEMFAIAARTLAAQTTQADLDRGCLYPPLASIREVSLHIAAAVAEHAFAAGLATVPRPADLLAWLRPQVYVPDYEPLVR
jgi:malate dehydrogenase (oxaloacetate-decarboxylating)(NADP+)